MSRFAPNVTRRPRAAALAALGALTTAALLAPMVAAAAQPDSDVPRTAVQYSYHDLASDAGTRALYQRIRNAARTVCPAYDPRDLAAFEYSRECQQQAVARAVREIGNERLAALHTRAVGARRG